MNDGNHGERVRAAILAAGLELWRCDPSTVSARGIGRRLGMTHSAVLYHHGTIAALRDAVAAHAVAMGDAVVIPMLIVARHPAVSRMPDIERAGWLAGFNPPPCSSENGRISYRHSPNSIDRQ